MIYIISIMYCVAFIAVNWDYMTIDRGMLKFTGNRLYANLLYITRIITVLE